MVLGPCEYIVNECARRDFDALRLTRCLQFVQIDANRSAVNAFGKDFFEEVLRHGSNEHEARRSTFCLLWIRSINNRTLAWVIFAARLTRDQKLADFIQREAQRVADDLNNDLSKSDRKILLDMLAKLEDHWKIVLKTCSRLDERNRTIPGLYNVPNFSDVSSELYKRPAYEENILAALKTIRQKPTADKSRGECGVGETAMMAGVLAITGEGGVGKTTIMAGLFHDKNFFTNLNSDAEEWTIDTVIWLDCFQWRDKFDESAFVEKLFEETNHSIPPRSGYQFESIGEFLKHFEKRLLLCFDDVYNVNLLKFIREHFKAIPCCILVRDTNELPDCNKFIAKKVNIANFSNDDVRKMLTTIYEFDRRLSDQSLLEDLVEMCCGLPLISSFIADQFKFSDAPCDVAVRNLVMSGVASAPRTEVRRNAFATLSDVFKFSVERLDEKSRKVFMAVLLWEPNERIALEDLALLWYASDCDISQTADLFSGRGLVRKVEHSKAENNDPSRRCYHLIIHQLLHQAALEYFCQSSGDRLQSEKEKMRLKISAGECLVMQECRNGADLLNAIMINKNRELLEKIFDRCDAIGLSAICALTPSDSRGLTFAHRLYRFTGWKDNWTRTDDKLCEFMFRTELVKAVNIVPDISKVGTMFQPNYSYRLLRKLINRLTSKENNEDVDSVTALDIMMNAVGLYGLFLAAELGFDFDDDEYMNERRLLIAALPLKYSENWVAYGHVYKSRCSNLYHMRMAAEGGPIFSQSVEGKLAALKAYPPQVICSAKRDEDGVTPLMLAAFFRQLEVVRLFCTISDKNVKTVDKTGWLPLFYAIQGGDLPTVSFLVNVYPESVDHRSVDGSTALLLAAMEGHTEIVKLLIDKTEYIEESALRNVFAKAASQGHQAIIEFLHRQYPSIILLRDPDNGRTLLHLAVLNQHVEIAMFLCKENLAAVKCVDKDGCAPLHFASAKGNLTMVVTLYEIFPDAVSLQDNAHRTPLHYATQNFNLDILIYLYNKYPKAALLASEIGTPLYLAATIGYIEGVKFFVERCKDIPKQLTDQFTELGVTCLMEAAGHGNLALVKYLHEKSPQSISLVSTKLGLTALDFAAGKGDIDTVRFLHKKYPEAIQMRSTQTGASPLTHAVSMGSFDVVRYLCDAYPDALKINDCQSQFHASSHMFAIFKDRMDVLQFFFDEYSQYLELTTDAIGLAMLNLAAATHNLPIVKYLCSLCPNLLQIEQFDQQCQPAPLISLLSQKAPAVTQFHQNKVTPLAAAILGLNCFAESFPYFLEKKSSPDEKLRVAENRMQVVTFLLEKSNGFVSFSNAFGNTPLLLAAGQGQFDVVKLLYEKYPNALLIPNQVGTTPFLEALSRNAVEILEFFHSKDRNCIPTFIKLPGEEEMQMELLNLSFSSERLRDMVAPMVESLGMTFQSLRERKDSLAQFDGLTPLMWSCGLGHLESVCFLCEKVPESINSALANGHTAFLFAIMLGKLEIVKFLCSKDANLVKVPILKSTPLHFSLKLGRSLVVVQFLFEQYPEALDIVDENGETPFLAAIRGNRVDSLEFLLEKRSDLVKQAVDSAGSTALHFAVENGNCEAVRFLCEKYPEALTIANSTTGMTPFLLAADIGNHEILSCLYDYDNSLVKVKHEKSGLSPLGIGVAKGHRLTVILLLKLYPDGILAENNSGTSPFHGAICSGNSGVVTFAYLLPETSDIMSALRDQHGNSLFELAVERGFNDVAKTIINLSKQEEDFERLVQRGRVNASVMLYNIRTKRAHQYLGTLLSELSKDVSGLSSGNKNPTFTSLKIIQRLSQSDGSEFFETFVERGGIQTLLEVLRSVRTDALILDSCPRKSILELRVLAVLNALSNRPTLHYLLMDERDFLIVELTERLPCWPKARSVGSKTCEVAVTTGRLIAKLMSYADSPFWLQEEKANLSENLTQWANRHLNFEFMTLSSYDDFGSMLTDEAPLVVKRFGIWFISRNAAMNPVDVLPKLNKEDQGIIVKVWQIIKCYPADSIIARFGREFARTNATDFLKPIFAYASNHCAPEELTNRLKVILKLAKEGEPIFNSEVASDCCEAFRNVMRSLRMEKLMTFADAARIETLMVGIVNRIVTKFPQFKCHLVDQPILLNEEIVPRLKPRNEHFNETAINAGRLIANILISPLNLSQKDDLSKQLAESLSNWVANDLKFQYIKFINEMFEELKPMLQMNVPIDASHFAVWLISKNAELNPGDAFQKMRKNQEMIKHLQQLVARHRSDPIILKFGQSLLDKVFSNSWQ